MSPRGKVSPENAMPFTALVVDDSMLIRHTVCRYLEERGFQVEAAGNGQEALEALRRAPADLIITDMQMPKMGGAELITVLKSQTATAHIPIVVVAGRQRGSEEGEEYADFAIYKDIDILDQLAKALEKTLGTSLPKARPAAK
jgi:CheY-like chemotaxis protein